MPPIPDLSVVVPFADDEDVIGTAVRRLAEHLSQRDLSFEIIAVDEDSGDNSHAILALLRPDLPELRISNAPGRGRGYAYGAHRARGRALWLIGAHEAARAPLSPMGRAYRRVARGEADMVSVEQRFVICHRLHCLPAIEGMRGIGWSFQRKLVKRCASRRLVVDSQLIGGSRALPRGRINPRPLSRLIGALAPAWQSSRPLW